MQSQHFKVSLNRKNPIWGAKLVEWFLMYCIIILKIYFTLVLPLDFFLSAEACVAVNFINNFGSEFKILSSLKHEAYLVTGSGFKLKLMINRPELHSHVTFTAEDPKWNRELLLNQKPNISEAVVEGCPDYLDVIVTSKKGKNEL